MLLFEFGDDSIINQLWGDADTCDIEIHGISEDDTKKYALHCHSIILEKIPLFKTMIETKIGEKKKKKDKIILEIDRYYIDDMEAFIQIIYGKKIGLWDLNDVFKLYDIARYFCHKELCTKLIKLLNDILDGRVKEKVLETLKFYDKDLYETLKK